MRNPWGVAGLIVGVSFVAVLAWARQEGDDIPDKFTNLQVLPKEIPKPQMVEYMKGMSRSLGVDCDHCHVTKGDDFDFAADDKKEKKAARVMIHMTNDINQKVKAVNPDARVTCWTCHRAEAKPEPAPVPGRPPAKGKS